MTPVMRSKKDPVEREFIRAVMEEILQIPVGPALFVVPSLQSTHPTPPKPGLNQPCAKDEGTYHMWLPCGSVH